MSEYNTNSAGFQDPLAEAETIVNTHFHSADQAGREHIAEALNNAKPLWSAGEILRAEFPAPTWIVPNLIPAGLTILAGRPKLGKSWLGLQIAVAVGSGGIMLYEQVDQRRVLYLALEDSVRRLQDRLQKQGCPETASIDFATEWPALIDNGLDLLLRAIEAGRYEFIVIDTLARFASERRADDERLVAQRLGDLQRYAQQHNIGVLLIDHHRKPAAGITDVIDDVMGATAKTGVADAALGLYRARGQQGAELKLTGRDVPDRELAVQFDRQLYCWQLLGDAAGARANTLQAAILDAIENNFGGQATCNQVAQFLGRDKANVYRELQELVAACRLSRQKGKAGREVPYRIVGNDSQQSQPSQP